MESAAVATLAFMTDKPMLASCPSGLPVVSRHWLLCVERRHGAGRPEDALGSSSMRAIIEG